MKKIILGFVAVLISLDAYSWTIGPMNYQGRLLDNNGIPLTGTYNFNVRIYDALTGGTLKFSEQQNNIAVDDGVYSFLVSTGTSPTGSWDINLWNTPSLYLEIEVNGQTLTPRHLLASTPFAFQANLALTTNNALALGGKSAGNILQDICKAGRGKWLELVNQCLGVGSSFPGPSLINLNTLTASADLSNLDLTNADISGINFGTANFTGSTLKGTTVSGAGIGSANMSNTIWDGVVATGSTTFANDFTGAKLSNINMSGWNMSGSILTNSSIVDISACPQSLPTTPAQYRCRNTGWTPPGDKFIVLGPNMNLSETSLVKDKIDADYNPYGTIFNNVNSDLVPVPVNLSGVSFAGNNLEAGFLKVDLSNANFSRSKIRHGYFEDCNLAGADFSQSSIHKSSFRGVQGNGYASFANSELNAVEFGTGANGSTTSFSFSNAVLDGVKFMQWGPGGLSVDFSGATLKNVIVNATVTYFYAISTDVFGGLYIGDNVSGVSFENMNFVNGNLSGNFRNIHDESSWYTNVSFNGADLTGSTGWENNTYTNVNWFGAVCPDGYQVTTQGGTCIGHFVP